MDFMQYVTYGFKSDRNGYLTEESSGKKRNL